MSDLTRDADEIVMALDADTALAAEVWDRLERHAGERLLAADRAGYERCKRDAATAIGEIDDEPFVEGAAWGNVFGKYEAVDGFRAEALAVVAALDATQAQGGGDGD